MTGYLRFFLAGLVFLSHLGVGIYGLNPGVVAVVVFYVLAGKVISKLFLEKFGGIPLKKRLKVFYVERSLRIFPVYIFLSFLTIFFLWLTKFKDPVFEIKNLLFNFLIIPVNFYMFLGNKLTILSGIKTDNWLIPTAWSLGLEMQAYLLLPLIMIRQMIFFTVFSLSFGIYVLSCFGIIHTEYFGYRLIPGTLFIFMIGHLINRVRKEGIDSIYGWSLGICYVVILGLTIYHFFIKPNYAHFVRETLIGLSGGIPVVYFLALFKKRAIFNQLLADLSYPFFLAHFLSFWILTYKGWFSVKFWDKVLYSFILTLIISFASIMIERPIKSWRFRFGKEASQRD